MSKTEQNTTKFEPRPVMLAFAELYVREQGNVMAVCERLKIDKGKYYRWTKKPGFNEWLSEYAKESVLKRYGKWYLTAERFAEKGSYSHLQLLFEIAKEFLPTTKLIYEGFNDAKLLELAKKKGVEIPDSIKDRLKGTIKVSQN